MGIQCPPVAGMVLPNFPQLPGPFLSPPLFFVILAVAMVGGPDTMVSRGLWLLPILKIGAQRLRGEVGRLHRC